uniref:Protein GAMETE EXPRESSED 1 n=1 Tax=Oryza barthii TaxID=65489 RepID=A0A0D3GUQ7_9ORYZ
MEQTAPATPGPEAEGLAAGDGGVPVADFSIDGGGDARGDKLMENARRRIAAGNGRPAGTTCWSEAYRSLFASCGDIMADKELQARLAWHLSSCFQEDSGRPPLPPCDAAAAHGHGHADMVHCRERLSDSESKVFLAFFLETNTLCHQLQAEAFKRSTERLVNDLTRSARSAREKLEAIEERSEKIMRESDHLRRSLSSIMSQTEHLATASEDVRARIGDVLDRSAAIFERSKEIAAAQAELRGGQAAMREELAAGMAQVEASYRSIGEEMGRLRHKAMGIEREVRAVGDAMAARMVDLQSAADDIGAAAGRSLENQMLLLDGQAKAMEGLNHLYSFQAQALQESRETIQKLAQFGQQQQEELLSRQEQIRHAHDDLMKNSESILEAQEEFRAKQASIFAALDKLYVLHNAVLVESRFIKAFFFYCCITFLVYLLTSAKQTFTIRGHLYFGLCITLVLETVVIKLGADDFSKQFLIMSKVLLIRSVFLAAAAAQILHSIFTYKDYEVLNHQLLQTLMEKVRAIEGNGSGGDQMNPWSTGSDCSSIGDCSWFFDEQLQDEVDSEIDPDFALPREICGNGSILPEEFGENSVTTSISRRYNLRPRIRPRFSEDNHIR